MIVTPSDFSDWKQNNVTKAFYEACQLRIQDAKDLLGVSAGVDSKEDSVLRGLIRAYTEMQNFYIEDLQEASND